MSSSQNLNASSVIRIWMWITIHYIRLPKVGPVVGIGLVICYVGKHSLLIINEL